MVAPASAPKRMTDVKTKVSEIEIVAGTDGSLDCRRTTEKCQGREREPLDCQPEAVDAQHLLRRRAQQTAL